jgi:hypothetical protein
MGIQLIDRVLLHRVRALLVARCGAPLPTQADLASAIVGTLPEFTLIGSALGNVRETGSETYTDRTRAVYRKETLLHIRLGGDAESKMLSFYSELMSSARYPGPVPVASAVLVGDMTGEDAMLVVGRCNVGHDAAEWYIKVLADDPILYTEK